MDKATEPCRLTCDALDHCRAKLRGTLSLTGTLIELFDQLHPVSRGARGRLSETHVYSPGGLARSYLDAAGFSAPTVPEDRLGPCAGALFGPWAEVQVRDRLPLVHVDFRRDYQTVFLLQRLQDLLAAERLEFVDDTQAVRAFVDRVTVDNLLDPAIYPQLNVLCWIRAAGETMVGRWAFKESNAKSGPGQFSIAIAPRYSDEVVIAYLGDVVVTKVLHPFACDINVSLVHVAPVRASSML